ncbi:MAG: hypothetical protein ACR2Q3_08855 [Woeseiaceae bacterium]
MQSVAALVVFRMLPVVFVVAAAIAYVFYVEGDTAYPFRNTLPMAAVTVLALLTLRKGGGRWTGAGWRWPLGSLGFAIPALGLSLYLHYGYATDMNGIYSESVYPTELFRYLPAYTCVAGCIGFAIGWIAGRNV